MIDGTITDKIYHGYSTRYTSGERKLIDFEKGERCICAKSYPFWRKTEHFLPNADKGIYKN